MSHLQSSIILCALSSVAFLQGYVLKKEDHLCLLTPTHPSKVSVTPPLYLKQSTKAGRPLCFPVTAGASNGNKLYFYVRDGLHLKSEPEFLTIIARGFAGREKTPTYLCALKTALGFAQDNLIHNMCLTFEFPDAFHTFGFHHGANPLMRLRHYIPPQTKMTLIGDCRGAVMSLEASIDMPNADCIILISGFLSVKELTRQMAHSYLGSEHLAPMMRTMMQAACPVFNPIENRFAQELKKVKGKSILLCHYKEDHMVSRQNALDLVNVLRENNTVYLLLIDHPHGYHSRLAHLPEVQQCINAFLKQCGRPHCALLAQNGESLLLQAGIVAQEAEKHF